VVDPFTAAGAGILSALVRIRAGLIIAAVAFIQLAVSVGDHSLSAVEPLKSFFVYVAMLFGIGGVVAMLMFFYDQVRRALPPQ
jgi:hypothetical protein